MMACCSRVLHRARLITLLFGFAVGVLSGSLLTWTALTTDSCGHGTAAGCVRPIKRHVIESSSVTPPSLVEISTGSTARHISSNQRTLLSSFTRHTASDGSALFVALLPSEDSTPATISTAALTWGQTVPKLMIFLSEGSDMLAVPPNIHVKRLYKSSLPNPTTLELLQTLQYLYHNHLNDSDWFFFASEKLYVNAYGFERLLKLLPSPSLPVYFGSSTLEVSEALSYCSGEGGILLSRDVLAKLVTNIGLCEKWGTIYSWAKGLGKCFEETVGGRCVSDLSSFFHKDNIQLPLLDLLYREDSSHYRNVFTVFPVTSNERMYTLHYYFTTSEYRTVSRKTDTIGKLIIDSCQELPDEIIKKSELVQTGCDLVRPDNWTLHDEEKALIKHRRTSRFRPINHFQYRNWQYFDAKRIYTDETTETQRHVGLYKYFSREFKRATEQATKEVNKKHHPKRMKFRSLVNGYVRNDALFGNEYIIDANYAELKHPKKMVTERVRILQPLQTGYTVKPSKNDALEKVNIIVPISGVAKRCFDFLYMFKNLQAQDRAMRLVLVIFGAKDEEAIRAKVKEVKAHNPNADITIVTGEGNFSRAQALDQGMKSLDKTDLAFLCDVDMEVNKSFFDRCRKNTIQGKMVYYPEVFKMYNSHFAGPEKNSNKRKLSRSKGHWGNYAFGMLCIYKSDYSKIGGLNTKMMGWGGEDVDFFEKVLRSRIEVLRAPDTGLIHRWHRRNCDKKSMTDSNYKQCLSSRAEALGDRRQLAHYLYLVQEAYPDLKRKLHIPM